MTPLVTLGPRPPGALSALSSLVDGPLEGAVVLLEGGAGLEQQAREVVDRGGRVVACLTREQRPRCLGVPAYFVCMGAIDEAELERELRELLADPSLTAPRVVRYEFCSLDQADFIAPVLAQALPAPERRVIGLLELCINAIEHGNLELSGEEKQRLLEAGEWVAELARRLAQPRFAGRRARLQLTAHSDHWELRVEDDGPGFNALALDQAGPEALRGRGIALARAMSFDVLRFEPPGNRAVATVRRAS